MTPKELNRKLVTTFPELERAYREQTAWQEGDDTGSHVVYGDVLVPAMLSLIKGGCAPLLKKYFDFIETLLCEGDDYAIDVAATTVIESIALDDVDELEVKPMLGIETLKVWDSIYSYRKALAIS